MYKIKVNERWIEVDEWIFRSWTGERMLDNKPHEGIVYYLGTNKVSNAHSNI